MAKTLDAAGVKRLIQEIKGANKNLNAPISISTENTPESMSQNVKNIADYVEKAKAAGIADVNGMAVTCIIDGDYSGVGYIYKVGGGLYINGIITYEDASNPFTFVVQGGDGTYTESELVTRSSNNQITSDMLVEGARKPIILTGDMTEVDEETYQKLSQEGTDVILSSGDGNGSFIGLQGIFNTGDTLILMFGYSDFNESDNGTIATYAISINTSAPHTLTLAATGACNPVPKSELISVLQEIDLTGTDAERKAKLDQFETDWKALTGASSLEGARFVGRYVIDYSFASILFTYSYNLDNYVGISTNETFRIYEFILDTQGSLTITPLFSHLEAITIYTDNTPEHMQANLANIAAYEANLQALGVTNVDGIMIPIKFEDDPENIAITFPFSGYITKYSSFYDGIVSTLNGAYKPRVITINGQQGEDGGKVVFETIALEKQLDNYTPKSLNAKSLEAITIRTGNTPEDKAANVAAIKSYVDNLKALGVDVTKGFNIPVNFDNNQSGYIAQGVNGNYVGYNTNINLFGGGFVVINSDGTYKALGLLTVGAYDNLTTTSKYIVRAINEVNALAKGYSTIFTPIELTTETAQNKTAIDARVAAFTAQGISLTNGCCIPVTYKGVYAGNISLINGDWYGLLVKNTNNPADNINIKLSADGTIVTSNSAQ